MTSSSKRSTSQRNRGRNGQPPTERERQPITSIIDRQPPYDLQAEICVLGSVFLLPTVLDELANVLKPDHFYDESHRILYAALLHFHENSKKFDDLLLVDYLKKRDEFDLIGGAAALHGIINAVPNAAHAVHYGHIVREKAIYRTIITASTEVLRDSYDELYAALDMVTQADAKFAKIAEDALINAESVKLADAVMLAMEELDAKMSGANIGRKTGIHGFDEVTRLKGGELIVLAARPSMGKSALAANIAVNVAKASHDEVTLFVSLEMNKLELVNRMLSSEASIDLRRMNDGTVTQADRLGLVETSGDLSLLPLHIDDNAMQTVSKIGAQARRLKRKHGLALIIIDYLQLIEADNPGDPRQEQVAKITRRLKLLARELNVPIMALAQLNRQTETTKDNRPRLAHLRESGAIEQDADIVMFCHRDSYYDKVPPQGWTRTLPEWESSATLILAKARNAPTRDIDLLWRKEFVRFENPASEHQAAYASTGAVPSTGATWSAVPDEQPGNF